MFWKALSQHQDETRDAELCSFLALLINHDDLTMSCIYRRI